MYVVKCFLHVMLACMDGSVSHCSCMVAWPPLGGGGGMGQSVSKGVGVVIHVMLIYTHNHVVQVRM
jgi:hypothetical protein